MESFDHLCRYRLIRETFLSFSLSDCQCMTAMNFLRYSSLAWANGLHGLGLAPTACILPSTRSPDEYGSSQRAAAVTVVVTVTGVLRQRYSGPWLVDC